MKHTFYFSHDYSARQDIKIKELLYEHGCLGYGIFWSIVEDLYINANALPADYKRIAFELRVEENVLHSVINDFDLFIVENGIISSDSIGQRIDLMKDKSKKARDSANYRWGKTDANAPNSHSEPNAIKENKIKENKDSINININTLSNSEFDNSSDSSKNDIQKDKDFELLKEFDKFRKKYPGTKRGAEIEFENLKKKHKKNYRDIIRILEKELDRQFEERTKRLQAKIFTPEWKNLQTYINNRSWEETFPIQEQLTNKNLEPEQSVVKRATGEVRFGGPKK